MKQERFQNNGNESGVVRVRREQPLAVIATIEHMLHDAAGRASFGSGHAMGSSREGIRHFRTPTITTKR